MLFINNETGKNWLMQMVHTYMQDETRIASAAIYTTETGVDNGRSSHCIILLHTSMLTIANVCAPHLAVQSPSPV